MHVYCAHLIVQCRKSTLSSLPLVSDLITQCDGIHASIPSLKSCIMSSAVSKALSIVVRMTPTGPVFTQPLQYRPAKEWNTTVQAEVEDTLVCLCGVRCVCGVGGRGVSLEPKCASALTHQGYVWCVCLVYICVVSVCVCLQCVCVCVCVCLGGLNCTIIWKDPDTCPMYTVQYVLTSDHFILLAGKVKRQKKRQSRLWIS